MSLDNVNGYQPIISAQIQCINELLSGMKEERLTLVHEDSNYCIKKSHNEPTDMDYSTILFQGKGRACHVFLNGFMAFFFTE
ncbi:hypothetical protein [Vibrio salinus]|uniref:hypothetical protein n=1 Tax=Vibrio salinus TaxID=2899784 RepID=UPI001E323EFF|nr:hypothetical protein [Vibrio salinus]MCE0494705.1 hypothetical protein [Vibrio salinus]